MVKIKETAGDDADEALELLESVEYQARFCRQLAAKVEVSKAQLKEDREKLDEAQCELTRRCLVRDEKHPLLDSVQATADNTDVDVTVLDLGKPRRMNRSKVADFMKNAIGAEFAARAEK